MSLPHQTTDATFYLDRVRRLRSLANVFDTAIPLPGGMRVGLDPIIGLIPVVGDAIGAVVAVIILIEAVNIGVPRSIVGRMIGNVLIDSLIGTIPFVGDLFDFVFKVNSRNVDLLERYHVDPKGTQKSSRLFLVVVALVCAVLLIAIPALIIFAAVQLVKLF
jgi:Domain of unknown function (DUF4112)